MKFVSVVVRGFAVYQSAQSARESLNDSSLSTSEKAARIGLNVVSAAAQTTGVFCDLTPNQQLVACSVSGISDTAYQLVSQKSKTEVVSHAVLHAGNIAGAAKHISPHFQLLEIGLPVGLLIKGSLKTRPPQAPEEIDLEAQNVIDQQALGVEQEMILAAKEDLERAIKGEIPVPAVFQIGLLAQFVCPISKTLQIDQEPYVLRKDPNASFYFHPIALRGWLKNKSSPLPGYEKESPDSFKGSDFEQQRGIVKMIRKQLVAILQEMP